MLSRKIKAVLLAVFSIGTLSFAMPHSEAALSACAIVAPASPACSFTAAGVNGVVVSTGPWRITGAVPASGGSGVFSIQLSKGTTYIMSGNGTAIVDSDRVCFTGAPGCGGQPCRVGGVGVCVSSANLAGDNEVSFAGDTLWVEVNSTKCIFDISETRLYGCP